MDGHTAVGGFSLRVRQALKRCKPAEGCWTIKTSAAYHVQAPSAGDAIQFQELVALKKATTHTVSQCSTPALPQQRGMNGLRHALTDPDGGLQEGHRHPSQVGGDNIGPGWKEQGVTLLVKYRQAVDLYRNSISHCGLDAVSAEGLCSCGVLEPCADADSAQACVSRCEGQAILSWQAHCTARTEQQ